MTGFVLPHGAVTAGWGHCRFPFIWRKDAMEARFLKLDETLYRYVLDHSLREHPEQTALRYSV